MNLNVLSSNKTLSGEEEIKELSEQRDKIMKKVQGYNSQLWSFDVYKSGMFGCIARVRNN